MDIKSAVNNFGSRAQDRQDIQIGIDTGGTFVDVVVAVGTDITVMKFPSVYHGEEGANNLHKAIIDASREIGFALNDVDILRFGTTLAVNAILERKLAKTLLLTTEGYRDSIELLRQWAPQYTLIGERPKPFIPRYLREEVSERVDSRGHVVVPLNVEQVQSILIQYQNSDVESVAISLLFSFLNPTHEEQTETLVRSILPNIEISTSSQLAPEMGETERTLTTALNASLIPITKRYLRSFDRLKDQGLACPIFVMQSNGGVVNDELASQRPVTTIMSGPTAGIVAAGFVARTADLPYVISMDVGGTSCDAALIVNGKVPVAPEGVLPGYPSVSPIKVAMSEISSIAIGGGSIAWVDNVGVLHVGPESQGSSPGPACYNRGGDRPTVTDANVVLGVIGSSQKLGGKIQVQPQLAWDTIAEHIAKPLGLSVEDAAAGIIRVATNTIANEMRLMSVSRGIDPREFTLLAFGGAGPNLAVAVVAELGITEVIIPEYPGALSAYGLLLADVRHDYARTRAVDAANANEDELETLFRAMEEQARLDANLEGIPSEELHLSRTVDVRYKGQLYCLPIPCSNHISGAEIVLVTEGFHQEHQRIYGYSAPGEAVQFVTLRLTCSYQPPHVKRLAEKVDPPVRGGVVAAELRQIYLGKDWVDSRVMERCNLFFGSEITGPVVIEQLDATTFIPPGFLAKVDKKNNLRIRRESV